MYYGSDYIIYAARFFVQIQQSVKIATGTQCWQIAASRWKALDAMDGPGGGVTLPHFCLSSELCKRCMHWVSLETS